MGKKVVFYLLGALILSSCGDSGKGQKESGGIAPVESEEVLLGVLQEALLNSSSSEGDSSITPMVQLRTALLLQHRL